MLRRSIGVLGRTTKPKNNKAKTKQQQQQQRGGGGGAFVYLATHPWIQNFYGADRVHKVGCSTNIGKRLESHPAYTTCFTPQWKLVDCFHYGSKDSALWAEKGCLDVLAGHRLDGRELVKLPREEIVRVIGAVSREMKLGARKLDATEMLHEIEMAKEKKSSSSSSSFSGEQLSRQQLGSPHAKKRLKTIQSLSTQFSGLLPPPSSPTPTAASSQSATAEPTVDSAAPVEDALVDTVLDNMVQHLHEREHHVVVDKQPATLDETQREKEKMEGREKKESSSSSSPESEQRLDQQAEAIVMTSHLATADRAHREQYLRHDAMQFRPIHLRAHQIGAVTRVLEEFRDNATTGSRSTIVQMACRCGKTPVAHALLCALNAACGQLMTTSNEASDKRNADGEHPDHDGGQGGGEDKKIEGADAAGALLRQHNKKWTADAAEILSLMHRSSPPSTNDDEQQQQQQQPNVFCATTGTTRLCVLYLVPSLSLVRQTAQKLVGYGGIDPTGVMLVGSDDETVYVHEPATTTTSISAAAAAAAAQDDGEEETTATTRTHSLNFTTDVALVLEFLSSPRRNAKVIVSTYQSSPLISVHDKAFRNVALIIFDECHRVCGGSAAGRDISTSPFAYHTLYAAHTTSHHQQELQQQQQQHAPFRLFMTATPQYDNPINFQRSSISRNLLAMRDGNAPTEAINPLSMRQRDLFGGVAYRYYLRQGIRQGYANDFSVKITLAPVDDLEARSKRRRKGLRAPDDKTIAKEMDEYGIPLFVTANQLEAALAHADKILVFCRNISHVEALYAFLKNRQQQEVAASAHEDQATKSNKNNNKKKKKKKQSPSSPSLLRDAEIYQAHSRDKASVIPALSKFSLKHHQLPGHKSILLNCRLFQEGVEVPHLNGVFFASPRGSAKDIIQCVCRPLNKMRGKPPSVVFLPIPYYSRFPISHQRNVEKMSKVVSFVDALKDEDPSLYEYFMDPAGCYYNISVIRGGSTAGARGQEKKRRGEEEEDEEEAAAAFESQVLPQFIKTVRFRGSRDFYRRPTEVPWPVGFAALKKVVTECGRYPKNSEAWTVGKTHIDLHAFYSHCRRAYLQCRYVSQVHDRAFPASSGAEKEAEEDAEKPLSALEALDPLSDKSLAATVGVASAPGRGKGKKKKMNKKGKKEGENDDDASPRVLQSAQNLFEPHQLRDLESLPHWKRYGIGGPYPPQECIRTLLLLFETPLDLLPPSDPPTSNKGEGTKKNKRKLPVRMPPLPIHRGGYVGLDATPLERLAGFLCTVNQHDARQHLSLAPRVAAAMAEVCGPYDVKWSKDRYANGHLRQKQAFTFIQQSYEDFKTEEARVPRAPWFSEYLVEHFPGYPHKHFAQERMDVLARGLSPPKIRRLSDVALKRRLTKELAEVAAAAAVAKHAAGGTPGSKSNKNKNKTPVAKGSSGRRKKRSAAELGQMKQKLALIEERSHESSKNNSSSPRSKKKQQQQPLNAEMRTNDPLFQADIEESRQVYKCRVCKVIVERDDWGKHLKSNGHVKRLAELQAGVDT